MPNEKTPHQLSPNMGPAPDPQRPAVTPINMGDDDPNSSLEPGEEGFDGIVTPMGGHPDRFGPPRDEDVEPAAPQEPQQESFQASPPPAEPEQAAESQDWKHRYGETIQALGDIKKQLAERDRQLQQMNLQMQAMMAAGAAGQPPQQSQAAGEVPEDPDATVTVSEMQNQINRAIQQQQEGFQAQTIVMQAGLTQQEIVDILQENPYLQNQNISPVRRAQFIVQAARLKRGPDEGNQPQEPSPQPKQEATQQQEERQERPIQGQRVVPQNTPPPARPAVSEPQSEDAVAQAMREYREAAKIQDKGERMKARKAALAKAMKAQGINDPSKAMATARWAQS
jgi:hypothetical protein